MNMKAILTEKFIRYQNGKAVIRAEIAADLFSDLPDNGQIGGCVLDMGSIAWVISTGKLYGLSSTGQWICQTEGE